MARGYISKIIENLLAVAESGSKELGSPKRILIVRQHNQLGDMLAGVSLFRALKETYPGCHLTLIASPANYIAVTKNRLLDRVFVYDKKRIFNPSYFASLLSVLREKYDLAIVPVTVSISFTSNLLARLSGAGTRIGVLRLNGMENKYAYFFDRRVEMDWKKHPDQNVADFGLEIVRSFGIKTDNFTSEISFDREDVETAGEFISSLDIKEEKLIGLHVGAGKPPNRWNLDKFIELTERLSSISKCRFFLTGSSADKDELDYILSRLNPRPGVFINKTIPQVAALISQADLFVTNDTGIMHVAGATATPQVSIFGPTNPYNWAPVGENKKFVWCRSGLIDEITVDEVFLSCLNALSSGRPAFIKQ